MKLLDEHLVGRQTDRFHAWLSLLAATSTVDAADQQSQRQDGQQRRQKIIDPEVVVYFFERNEYMLKYKVRALESFYWRTFPGFESTIIKQ